MENEVAIIEEVKSLLYVAHEAALHLSEACSYKEGWSIKDKLKLNTYSKSDLTEIIGNASSVLGLLDVYRNSIERLQRVALDQLVSETVNGTNRKDY